MVKFEIIDVLIFILLGTSAQIIKTFWLNESVTMFCKLTVVLSSLMFVTITDVCASTYSKNIEIAFLINSPSNTGRDSNGAASELNRQMSTALDASGQRVFSAYATKINAAHNVIVRDKNGNPVPLAANIANGTLYHQFDKPLIFVKRPGCDSQYFLFTQVSNGVRWDPLESTCRHASLSIL